MGHVKTCVFLVCAMEMGRHRMNDDFQTFYGAVFGGHIVRKQKIRRTTGGTVMLMVVPGVVGVCEYGHTCREACRTVFCHVAPHPEKTNSV